MSLEHTTLIPESFKSVVTNFLMKLFTIKYNSLFIHESDNTDIAVKSRGTETQHGILCIGYSTLAKVYVTVNAFV